jgi:hypothetical protein
MIKYIFDSDANNTSYLNTVAWCFEAKRVEPEETSISRWRLGTHVTTTNTTQATIELILSHNNIYCVFYVVRAEEAESVEFRDGIAGSLFWKMVCDVTTWVREDEESLLLKPSIGNGWWRWRRLSADSSEMCGLTRNIITYSSGWCQ